MHGAGGREKDFEAALSLVRESSQERVPRTLKATSVATRNRVDPPKAFGVKIGGGYCHGAAGGSQGIDVYAIYRQ